MARTLVFVHAHPDDEALLTSGTMAKAAALGHRVVLVMATDGAAGLSDAALTPGLAKRRADELAESAQILGVHRVVDLGFADSGLAGDRDNSFVNTGVFTVGRTIAKVLDEESADIVVGYDSNGGYGHPDHRHVHRAVRTAALLAQRQPRVFEATLPREPIVRAVRIAAAARLTPRGFDPAEFDQAWTPRELITHRVNVKPFLAQKRKSLQAHASQATADGSLRTLAVLTRLPSIVASPLLGTEYYSEVPAATMASTTPGSR